MGAFLIGVFLGICLGWYLCCLMVAAGRGHGEE